jgi:hypothetical protein
MNCTTSRHTAQPADSGRNPPDPSGHPAGGSRCAPSRTHTAPHADRTGYASPSSTGPRPADTGPPHPDPAHPPAARRTRTSPQGTCPATHPEHPTRAHHGCAPGGGFKRGRRLELSGKMSSLPTMTAFLATLAANHVGNWDICKRELLWGVPHSSHAERAALAVVPGDTIFIWRSKAPRVPGGLMARVTATSAATPAINPPWPDHDRYSYIFSIKVDDELSMPIGDRFPGNKISVLFGVPNMTVNWGFGHLSSAAERKMTVALHGR